MINFYMVPEELKKIPLNSRPHVVILGAGASFAATPDGEASNLKIPLMKDLPDVLYLKNILDDKQLYAAQHDFEIFYNFLVESKNISIQKEIDARIFSYFNTIRISEKVTLYDRLVLSLRKKDVIATFNWDPLLPYAYRRNGKLKILPDLLFLHGNVKMGACINCKHLGWNDDVCSRCGNPLENVRLIYPIEHKDYSSDPVINEQWNKLEWYLENAYFVTIFGYSAPKTDVDARSKIIDKLSGNKLKNLFQLEIIDPNADMLVKKNLSGIVDGKHYGCYDTLEQSWLSRHPRFTCEALFQATMKCSPIKPYIQPNTVNLLELQGWAEEFQDSFPDFLKEGHEGQG